MNYFRNFVFAGLTVFSTTILAEEPTATAPVPAMEEPTLIGGPILAILDAGRYQYLEIDAGSGSVWVAVVQQPVSTGQHVTCTSAMAMEKFESKSLGRTFDRVYFADGLQVDGASVETTATASSMECLAPEGHADMGMCTKPAESPAPLATMDKPEGGVTIAELVEQQEKLAGTDVVLRAQISKITLDIMDANWIHVQDASTDHDLVVSCKAAPAVGDVVVIRGKLERNVTIGSDHVYELLIQGAEVTIEPPSGN